MKIFYVNSVCGSGSTGRIVTDLCQVLEHEGHEACVAYGVGNASKIAPDRTIRINNKPGYYAHNLLSRVTDRAGFYSANATKKLVKAIREYKPDLIHLHNLHGYYLNIALLFEFLAEAGIPVVWTLHDCWPMTGHCAHFDYARCDKWRDGCGHCPQLNTYPKSWLADQSARNYSDKRRLFTSVPNMTIVTPSRWLADIVQQSFLGQYPVTVIPNGIDLNVFKPTPSRFREDHGIGSKTMVLAVANVWSKKKGYEDICALADMLDSRKYQVVMVGLTEKQAKAVPNTVVPITRTSSVEELAGIYSAADVFVNATYQDNFPTVNIEALACGTPIISYDTGGSPESYDPSCGLTVKKGDIHAMAEAVSRFAQYDRGNAVSRAKQFDRNIKYAEYLKIYSSVI